MKTEPKTFTALRLDSDVVRAFKAQGAGHLTKMNAVLRSYAIAQGWVEMNPAVPPSKRGRPKKD